MNERPHPAPPDPTASDQALIDRIATEFAAALKQDRRPRIADYLAGVPERLQDALQIELAAEDAEKTRGVRMDDFPLLEFTCERDGNYDIVTGDGRYQNVVRLGEGGMGIVFQGRDRGGQEVALKTLWPELAAEQDFVKRFVREGETLQKIKSENVVSVLEVNTCNGRPYIVMPRLHGETLAARLARQRGPFDPSEAVALVIEVVRGLMAVHAKRIVHRDLKPSNIWLERLRPADRPAERGPPGLLLRVLQWVLRWLVGLPTVARKGIDLGGVTRVLIMDFGLARVWHAAGDGKDPRSLTRASALAVLGTVAYVSPEQFEDPARATESSDVYSLGVVFYEMLTGENPFKDKSPTVSIGKMFRSTPAPPNSKNAAVPPALAGLVMEMLRKDPGQRPKLPAVADRLRDPQLMAKQARVGEARRASKSRPAPVRVSPLLKVKGLTIQGITRLIDCPGCGHHISRTAAACPRCGHPTSRSAPIPVLRPVERGFWDEWMATMGCGCAVLVAGVILLGLIFSILYPQRPLPPVVPPAWQKSTESTAPMNETLAPTDRFSPEPRPLPMSQPSNAASARCTIHAC